MKTFILSFTAAMLIVGCSNPQINYTVVPYAVFSNGDPAVGGDLVAESTGAKCPQPNEAVQPVYSGPAISLAFTVDNSESFNCVSAVLTVGGQEKVVVVPELSHSGVHRFDKVTSVQMRITETPVNLIEGQALATGNVEVWF